MAETFYVGAYWGPRVESVDACADRLARMLIDVAEASPLLGSWFRTAGNRQAALKRPIEPSAERLRELLLAGQARRDDPARSVMSELGFSADMWNGQDVQVGLHVHCGTPAAIPGMTSNNLVIQLPAAEGAALALYQRDTAVAVLRAVIAAWRPDWCTWTSRRLRRAQELQPFDVVAGWATYVVEPAGAWTDRLPAGIAAEQVGSGLLLTSQGDADSASEATACAMRDALGPARSVR